MNDTHKQLHATTEAPNGKPDDKPSNKPAVRKAAKPKPVRWKKWLIIAGIGAAALALAAVMLQPSVIDVQLAQATQGPLSEAVEAQGQTRAKLRYTVAASISGRLLRTSIGVGDRIERGDVLAQIAPPPTDARSLATARAELAAAQARQRQAHAVLAEATSGARLASTEAARRSELFRMGMVSVESRDAYAQTAQAAADRVASAEASLVAAGAEVQSARSRLLGAGTAGGDAGAIMVRAPVSGHVLKVIEESERVVQAGSPLFELSQGEALELVVDVLTQDAVQVQAGQPIDITGWGGPRALVGKVRYVEPGAFTKVSALGVQEQRVNVIGDLDAAPPTLGAGYRIEAAIVTWSGNQVLQIPTGALFRRAGAWQTFAVEEGRARLRRLEVGHRNAEFAEVTAGIQAGESVVVFPSDLVADGVRVRDGSARHSIQGMQF